MKSIKKSIFENLIEASLHKIGELSIKIAESSADKCCSYGGMYETKFPQELLKLEEE